MGAEANAAEQGPQAKQHRVGSKFLLTLGGLIGAVVITVPLHWNNALSILAGVVLPVALGMALARVSRYRLRFPGLTGLGLTLAGILVICWMAKYPNPQRAFAAVMQTPVPDGVRDLSAECGWFDGKITILRFTADPEIIRKLLPPRVEVDHLGEDRPIKDAWGAVFLTGAIVDPSLRQFPGWTQPRRAVWQREDKLGPTWLEAAWDEATGQAILYVHEE